MLIEQRNRPHQREELHVIAPRADHGIGKGLLLDVFIDDAQRSEQSLGIALQLNDLGAVVLRPHPLDGLCLALLLVDRLGLLPLLVHREHDAAIQQLLVHVIRRGGQEDHHRAFHRVVVRHVLAAHRVFAGGRDF